LGDKVEFEDSTWLVRWCRPMIFSVRLMLEFNTYCKFGIVKPVDLSLKLLTWRIGCLQRISVVYSTYLWGGKDPKLPSTGIVPQRSLLETSLYNQSQWGVRVGFKLADTYIYFYKKEKEIQNEK
jgi:hypothetical protein